MTIRGFFIYGFLQWLLISVLKLIFFKYQVVDNSGLQWIIYWLLTAVVAAAMVRRLGVMNFFEAIFVIGLWVLGDMFSDLVLTSVFTGMDIFQSVNLWVGYGFQALAIFIFHKMRHIEIRKEQRAHHHGHGHH